MQIDIISLITLFICLVTLGVLTFLLFNLRKGKISKVEKSNEEIIQLIGTEKLISIYETLIKIGIEVELDTKNTEKQQYLSDSDQTIATKIETQLIKVEFEGDTLTIPKTF